MAAPLVSLNEYKAMAGITHSNNDAQITSLLQAASKAVTNYAGRSFEIATGPPTERTFLYDGSGALDTDDFTTLVSLSTDMGAPGLTYDYTADQYTLMPQDTDDTMPYSWIVFHIEMGWGYSGEMGFERNLDQYGIIGREPIITVLANWGWPAIPEDVKLATVWTLQSVLSDKEGPVAESIEGYSRSYGSTGAGLPLLGVPNRARDILAPYQKLYA